jgi:hypothetical protein
LEHHICTGCGVSDKTYKSAIDKILYGIGKGRCVSPIIWALLNKLLLTALGEKFDCIQLVDIEGKMNKRPCDYFVDDTTTGATNDDVSSLPVDACKQGLTEEEEKLVAKMRTIIQFFLDFLQVTGGDLAPWKCAWYLISHHWKDGIPRLLKPDPTHSGLEIVLKSTGTTAGIKPNAPEEGHRTLGFHLAVDGTSTAHKKVMTDKVVLHGEAITHSTLRQSDIGIAHNFFYMPSLA